MHSLVSVGGGAAWKPMLKHLLDDDFWLGCMDMWLVLVLFSSTRGEIEGFMGDRSWPCPASRAAVMWLAWVSDVVLGMDGRTA